MSSSDDPTRAAAVLPFSERRRARVDRRVATHDRRQGAFRGGRRASDRVFANIVQRGRRTTDALNVTIVRDSNP